MKLFHYLLCLLVTIINDSKGKTPAITAKQTILKPTTFKSARHNLMSTEGDVRLIRKTLSNKFSNKNRINTTIPFYHIGLVNDSILKLKLHNFYSVQIENLTSNNSNFSSLFSISDSAKKIPATELSVIPRLANFFTKTTVDCISNVSLNHFQGMSLKIYIVPSDISSLTDCAHNVKGLNNNSFNKSIVLTKALTVAHMLIKTIIPELKMMAFEIFQSDNYKNNYQNKNFTTIIPKFLTISANDSQNIFLPKVNLNKMVLNIFSSTNNSHLPILFRKSRSSGLLTKVPKKTTTNRKSFLLNYSNTKSKPPKALNKFSTISYVTQKSTLTSSVKPHQSGKFVKNLMKLFSIIGIKSMVTSTYLKNSSTPINAFLQSSKNLTLRGNYSQNQKKFKLVNFVSTQPDFSSLTYSTTASLHNRNFRSTSLNNFVKTFILKKTSPLFNAKRLLQRNININSPDLTGNSYNKLSNKTHPSLHSTKIRSNKDLKPNSILLHNLRGPHRVKKSSSPSWLNLFSEVIDQRSTTSSALVMEKLNSSVSPAKDLSTSGVLPNNYINSNLISNLSSLTNSTNSSRTSLVNNAINRGSTIKYINISTLSQDSGKIDVEVAGESKSTSTILSILKNFLQSGSLLHRTTYSQNHTNKEENSTTISTSSTALAHSTNFSVIITPNLNFTSTLALMSSSTTTPTPFHIPSSTPDLNCTFTLKEISTSVSIYSSPSTSININNPLTQMLTPELSSTPNSTSISKPSAPNCNFFLCSSVPTSTLKPLPIYSLTSTSKKINNPLTQMLTPEPSSTLTSTSFSMPSASTSIKIDNHLSLTDLLTPKLSSTLSSISFSIPNSPAIKHSLNISVPISNSPLKLRNLDSTSEFGVMSDNLQTTSLQNSKQSFFSFINSDFIRRSLSSQRTSEGLSDIFAISIFDNFRPTKMIYPSHRENLYSTMSAGYKAAFGPLIRHTTNSINDPVTMNPFEKWKLDHSKTFTVENSISLERMLADPTFQEKEIRYFDFPVILLTTGILKLIAAVPEIKTTVKDKDSVEDIMKVLTRFTNTASKQISTQLSYPEEFLPEFFIKRKGSFSNIPRLLSNISSNSEDIFFQLPNISVPSVYSYPNFSRLPTFANQAEQIFQNYNSFPVPNSNQQRTLSVANQDSQLTDYKRKQIYNSKNMVISRNITTRSATNRKTTTRLFFNMETLPPWIKARYSSKPISNVMDQRTSTKMPLSVRLGKKQQQTRKFRQPKVNRYKNGRTKIDYHKNTAKKSRKPYYKHSRKLRTRYDRRMETIRKARPTKVGQEYKNGRQLSARKDRQMSKLKKPRESFVKSTHKNSRKLLSKIDRKKNTMLKARQSQVGLSLKNSRKLSARIRNRNGRTMKPSSVKVNRSHKNSRKYTGRIHKKKNKINNSKWVQVNPSRKRSQKLKPVWVLIEGPSPTAPVLHKKVKSHRVSFRNKKRVSRNTAKMQESTTLPLPKRMMLLSFFL